MGDEQLAAAARDGDDHAFELLHRRYLPIARRSAARAGRSLPQLDVDAAVSLALTRLWQSLEAYDPARPFAPWAAMVISRATRTAAEAARTQKVSTAWWAMVAAVREDDDATPLLDTVADDGPSALDQLLADDEAQVVARLLELTLSAREQAAMRLRLAGWSYADIAHRLGVDAKAVDNALRRATGKLRANLVKSDPATAVTDPEPRP